MAGVEADAKPPDSLLGRSVGPRLRVHHAIGLGPAAALPDDSRCGEQLISGPYTGQVRIEGRAVAEVVKAVEAQIPFNRALGLHLDELTGDGVSLTFDWREELVGNWARGALHGGAISAALDVVGGLTAMMAAAAQADDTDLADRFSRLGTIDLRVDYLRPGVGTSFLATGYALRIGSRVAVTRMELHNQDRTLIAVGTGTYIVG
jgi:uncharacterized protein (TIGR00369 family)